ncbi:Matrilin-2 [Geodia barretti]|uniref:Matrilin-2 n=1 Tax=Geodia barretti TaxID=519541 RepID=A0AA35TVR3_GEOBA|nr:Matrilin-2 [Geodia barretti]
MNNGGCEQICTDTFLSYNCSCEDGYLLNGDGTCSDIDECLGQDHGCEGICVNTDGSFFCNCSDGFLLNIDGKACTDINECMGVDHRCEYSCENTVGSYTCGCDVGFELNTDGRTCRETLIFTLLLSMEGTGHETHVVPRVDDGISDPILVTDGFPLGCSRHSTIYVGTNGYFAFSEFTGFTPFPFSEGNELSLVAPFFTDIDISKGSGRIVYQVHNNFSDIFSSQVAQYINVAINTNRYTNFSAEWILIATWTEVSPYNTNNVKATFFGILATDYQRSFAVFIYNCENGNATFSNRATVGFVTSDGFYANHEASYGWNPYPTLCRNHPTSQWAQIIYEISGDDPTRCISYTEY